MVFFDITSLYMPGKFWYGQKVDQLGQNLAIINFLAFLVYIFQMPLQIFLIFGMELFFGSSVRKSQSMCWENSEMAKNWANFAYNCQVPSEFLIFLP